MSWILIAAALLLVLAPRARALIAVMRAGDEMMDDDRRVTPVDPEDPAIPERTREALWKLGGELEALGFHQLGWIRYWETGLTSVFSVAAVDPEGRVIGYGYAWMVLAPGGTPKERTFFSFVSSLGFPRFAETSNGFQPDGLPYAVLWNLPRCRETASLLAAHRALVASEGTPVDAAPRDLGELMERLWRLEALGIEEGLRDGTMRQTPKGPRLRVGPMVRLLACSLPGPRGWIRARRRARMKAALRRAGVPHLWATGR